MSRRLAIRFDVDTHRCVRQGMPALSELGRRLEAPFTFFVNMGRAISRPEAFAAGLGRAVRTEGSTAAKLSARAKLGTRRWLEVALLNPVVGAGSPDVLCAAGAAGHEVGLHGGLNHARWQAGADGWSRDRLAVELDAVLPPLRTALGGAPVRGFASPGWTTHPALPDLLAERGFEYLADLHGPAGSRARSGPGPTDRAGGHEPSDGEGFQRPGPLPLVRTQLTGEPGGVAYLEHLRAVGLDEEGIVARFASDLTAAGERVALYDHPYHAGIRELATLERIVDAARARGYQVVPMADLAEVG